MGTHARNLAPCKTEATRHWRRCIFTDCGLWVLFGRWRFEDCHFVRSKFMFVDSAGQVAQIAQDLVTQRPRN